MVWGMDQDPFFPHIWTVVLAPNVNKLFVYLLNSFGGLIENELTGQV